MVKSAGKGSKTKGARSLWAPERRGIVWIDCNPKVGREMRDVFPFLVLSPREFNEKTSLVIGLPMTTAQYNADNPFAVAVGLASGRKAEQISYVLCHQPKSFAWRLRAAKPHPIETLPAEVFEAVCERLNQIIQLA